MIASAVNLAAAARKNMSNEQKQTDQTLQRLETALACPVQVIRDDLPAGARDLLHECWVSLLRKYLPEGSAADLLVNEYGVAHGTVSILADDCNDETEAAEWEGEKHNKFKYDLLTVEEATRIIQALEQSRFDIANKSRKEEDFRLREDIASGRHPLQTLKSPSGIWIDKEFTRLARWLWAIRVVEGRERDKHWPPLMVKSRGDLYKHSVKKRDVGWLNVDTSADRLRGFGLGLLAKHFSERINEKCDDPFNPLRVEYFFETWQAEFQSGTFRLGLEHFVEMGVFNGKPCRKVVYDFDLDQNQFHCFPTLEFPVVRAHYFEGGLDF